MDLEDSIGSVEAPETEMAGLTRREALRRGAAFSGLIWVPPVVSSMQLNSASAQVTSPTTSTTGATTTTTTVPGGPDIGYIGLQVTCGEGEQGVAYTIKFDGCDGSDCFEPDPGNFPACAPFVVDGDPVDGDELGFTVSGPAPDGSVTIHVPAGCVVTASVIKGGQCCDPGPTGTGSLVFPKPAPC